MTSDGLGTGDARTRLKPGAPANLQQARREPKKKTNRLSLKPVWAQVGTFPSTFGGRDGIFGLIGEGLSGVSSPRGPSEKQKEEEY